MTIDKTKILVFLDDFSNVGQVTTGRVIYEALIPFKMVTIVPASGENPDALLEDLRALPCVLEAEFNMLVDKWDEIIPYPLDPVTASMDPMVPLQWGLIEMEVYEAWKHTNRGLGVLSAHADAGIRGTHDKFREHPYLTGYTVPAVLASYGDWRVDGSGGHGTACASFYACQETGDGMVGVAPNSTHYVMKFSHGAFGGANEFSSVLAECMTLGIKVITCSNTYIMSVPPTIGNVYKAAGGVLLNAAGNVSKNVSSYPAASRATYKCVGALRPNGHIDVFSNFGAEVVLYAPGVHLYAARGSSAATDSSYTAPPGIDGTSFACPHAGAVLALVQDANPSLSGQQCLQIARDTALKLQGTHWVTMSGGGQRARINAHRAVLKAKSLLPENADVVFPYISFWGPGVDKQIVNGELVTNLSGTVYVRLDAYSRAAKHNLEFKVGDTTLWNKTDPAEHTTNFTPLNDVHIASTAEELGAAVCTYSGGLTAASMAATVDYTDFMTDGASLLVKYTKGVSILAGKITVNFGEYDVTGMKTLLLNYKADISNDYNRCEIFVGETKVAEWPYYQGGVADVVTFGTKQWTVHAFDLSEFDVMEGMQEVKFVFQKYVGNAGITDRYFAIDKVYFSSETVDVPDIVWNTEELQGEIQFNVTPMQAQTIGLRKSRVSSVWETAAPKVCINGVWEPLQVKTRNQGEWS